ncbi:sporulation integral membrane protein YlbJ [Paenibacillus sp. SC116]|uniref:sporulation integral membrane protein YlbJ n=1 Tax=Paenibacillus sp. SC116 TaxID=2968986 RepID=UPI00215B2F40|nr:sporulation integral membrane protein YlbJ [Paenibacillus sp. SC116]MCR8846052.1 sporulation integral membrane protein YlbJ [Paenibacillus sp. SC116]
MPWYTKIGIIVRFMLLSAIFALMLQYPASILQAALRGVGIWWDVLFPSLLPFFIISEALLGFGIVHGIGALLDPIMRPLFRVPGVGGFVVAMGYASGYPVGAKLTTRLRSEGLLTREEGERLVSFTTTSDPIFLIGAVAVGFFGTPALALPLAIAHYGAGLLLGIIMRFHAYRSPPTAATNHLSAGTAEQLASRSSSIWITAFRAMHTARLQDGRPLGTLLTQAIQSSLKLMMVVGGLVVFFSVMMELLSSAGIMKAWDYMLRTVLSWIHLPESLAPALSGGIFEVTLGAKAAGSAEGADLRMQVTAAAWIVSWAGLSVHAQVASLLNESDLRYTPFLIARLIHGILAGLFAYLLFPWLAPYSAAWTSFLLPATHLEPHTNWSWVVHSLQWGGYLTLGICLLLLFGSCIVRIIRLLR